MGFEPGTYPIWGVRKKVRPHDRVKNRKKPLIYKDPLNFTTDAKTYSLCEPLHFFFHAMPSQDCFPTKLYSLLVFPPSHPNHVFNSITGTWLLTSLSIFLVLGSIQTEYRAESEVSVVYSFKRTSPAIW